MTSAMALEWRSVFRLGDRLHTFRSIVTLTYYYSANISSHGACPATMWR